MSSKRRAFELFRGLAMQAPDVGPEVFVMLMAQAEAQVLALLKRSREEPQYLTVEDEAFMDEALRRWEALP